MQIFCQLATCSRQRSWVCHSHLQPGIAWAQLMPFGHPHAVQGTQQGSACGVPSAEHCCRVFSFMAGASFLRGAHIPQPGIIM